MHTGVMQCTADLLRGDFPHLDNNTTACMQLQAAKILQATLPGRKDKQKACLPPSAGVGGLAGCSLPFEGAGAAAPSSAAPQRLSQCGFHLQHLGLSSLGAPVGAPAESSAPQRWSQCGFHLQHRGFSSTCICIEGGSKGQVSRDKVRHSASMHSNRQSNRQAPTAMLHVM